MEGTDKAGITGTMKSETSLCKHTLVAPLLVGRGLACLTLLVCSSMIAMSQTASEKADSIAGSALHVTHILGFADVRHNANGELRIEGDLMQFRRNGSQTVQVSITSIQNIFVGEEDQQVGGVPMMLGKTAVPFGGGRVVSLFSHKKYDSLTVEYLDSSGGFHGAIFRLGKGRGETFKKGLLANGALIAPQQDQDKTSTPEVKNENK